MSKVQRVSRAELSRARTDTRLAIIGELTKLIDRLTEAGWTQTQIAERLGVSRAHISQLLSAPEDQNWTLDTLASLLAAARARITRIEMRFLDEIPPVNEVHPWLEGHDRREFSAGGGIKLKVRGGPKTRPVTETETKLTATIRFEPPK
ncbi:MAG: helix-turn-helix transcriptional regulator [Candidatus Odyssella sp.]|nr:helix-turn-helix transcriptional regulator [Candidatus Odyssella sp.]